ncbi:helix-turn-helix domain-containing protein [Edaphovirga cremea]|uniref:helix-turn-helix domain-containing protein n=1 Tax=Edaphovirga cremea TaxID=2267246 RepID=UPI003989D328
MLVTMSQKELDRIPVLQQLCDKCLTQSRAAKLLNLSVRQVQRLLNRYQSDGAAGLSSQKRGKPANWPALIREPSWTTSDWVQC